MLMITPFHSVIFLNHYSLKKALSNKTHSIDTPNVIAISCIKSLHS